MDRTVQDGRSFRERDIDRYLARDIDFKQQKVGPVVITWRPMRRLSIRRRVLIGIGRSIPRRMLIAVRVVVNPVLVIG